MTLCTLHCVRPRHGLWTMWMVFTTGRTTGGLKKKAKAQKAAAARWSTDESNVAVQEPPQPSEQSRNFPAPPSPSQSPEAQAGSTQGTCA